jgi:sterol desaturase/sphingolipid hydroxylase (fatty acid hydroxylase superfamily)
LYKQFHSTHHNARYTVSIASEYFHPVEYIVGIVLPVFLPPLLLRSHMLTYLIWLCFKLFETTTAHSGYDFGPWFPNSREHSYHHSHISNNYGSFFNVWDRLLGTDQKFLEFEEERKKKELEKSK